MQYYTPRSGTMTANLMTFGVHPFRRISAVLILIVSLYFNTQTNKMFPSTTPFVTSFRRIFYAYHQTMTHHHTNKNNNKKKKTFINILSYHYLVFLLS